MTKAERESIVRWDCELGTATVYTADLQTMRRLTRRGYVFRALSPQSWQAEVPKRAVSLRRLPLTVRKAPRMPFVARSSHSHSGLAE